MKWCQITTNVIINSQENKIKIGNEEITGSESVKLLGATIDQLNFNKHIKKYLHTVGRISRYLSTD